MGEFFRVKSIVRGRLHFMLMRIYSLALLSIFFTAVLVPAAMADSVVKSLTKENIQAFIQDTSQMSNPRSIEDNTEDIHGYLDRHLSGDSRFISTVTYHIPDMPAQSMAVNYDKSEFIKTVIDGAGAIEGYENKVKVTDVQINWWGNKAHIKTENTETGFMAVPRDDGGHGESVPIHGKSKCAQTLALDDGVIQMKHVVCKTDIVFKQ